MNVLVINASTKTCMDNQAITSSVVEAISEILMNVISLIK